MNLLLGILFSFPIIFISFSNSFKYLPKYNNLISYIISFPFFPFLISCISLISNEENGKNNTSFSSGINDIFSISACVDRLKSILSSFSNINSTLHNFLFLFSSFKKFSAISLSLENDKNDLENTIEPGKFSIFLFK